MSRPIVLFLSLTILLSIVDISFAQKAESEEKTAPGKLSEKIIGTWKLISIEDRLPEGKVIYPMGRNPLGYLMYDSTGHMSQQLMNPDRPKVAVQGERIDVINEVIFFGFDAYSGTYSIDEEKGTIHYRIECSIYPTVVGTELKRKIEISGDQLILTPAPFIDKNDGLQHVRTNTWKRVK
jgi:hypothetical protein